MKKHAIIPVFIPHIGCPHNCVFCNQNAITARSGAVTPEDAERIVEEYLPTLSGRGLEEIELSYFGGSFTGIPMEEQSALLAVAKRYKDEGKIDRIHLSTRPDYIDRKILDNLAAYGADVIELGVQSMDDGVLRASGRGHDSACVERACELIKSYGCFTLGIQLMIGLPGDTYATCVESARRAAAIGPDIARLYPTVIITQTPLYDMYMDGRFTPVPQDEMLRRTVDMYRILTDAGINVIRIGLKSTALINDSPGSRVAGDSYHPAFGQLVLGEVMREKARALLDGLRGAEGEVALLACEETLPALVGHKACNKRLFEERYPRLRIRYLTDNSLAPGEAAMRRL